jgi:general stress protein 26
MLEVDAKPQLHWRVPKGVNRFRLMNTSEPVKVSEEEKREHLRKLVAGFDTAMLVTSALTSGLRSRPLSIAKKRSDDTLYFATAIDSEKVQEIERNSNVNVALQDGRRFVSLTGRARIVHDRALVHELWSESWKVWFPKGETDPSLCLLAVDPLEATYWDGAGATGLKYLFEMARAYVTGTQPKSDDDERHTGHVKL